jgi:predicted outer membrane repeat protein
VRNRFVVGLTVLATSAASVAVLAFSAPSAIAATAITVDSAADGTATATNCLPVPVTGACTLRDAFAAASAGGAGAGDDVTVTVDPSVTAISLTEGELAYDGGTGGAHSLTIDAARTTVAQTEPERIMHNTGSGRLWIEGFTLTGGGPDGSGGAIQSLGDLVVIDSALVFNEADDGGAIDVVGELVVIRSTIANNQAGGFGGAIEVEGDAPVTLVNTTISGNAAGSIGGGLAGTDDVTLVYSTIADNSAPEDEGANLDSNGGMLTSFGSVIALPDGGSNCQGFSGTTSHGFNLEDDIDATCGFSVGTNDLPPGTSAGLSALADGNVPGPLMQPEAGSPLIDAIPVASCQSDGAEDVTTDERGTTRPQGPGCDIGAVEIPVLVVELPTPVPPEAIPTPPRFTG